MNIRHLRYFVTLAREGHHGRAAATCNVTQPTLTGAIAQLERALAVPLIARKGQRFAGLTDEGERVLLWAQRILADQDALERDIATMRVGLGGVLRIGAIPAATPVIPLVTSAFCQSHDKVTLRVLSQTSIEIERALEAGEIDVGLTYLDNEPLRSVRTYPLYKERYMLLTPRGGPFGDRASVSWAEAAALALCLLTRDMQNRRIMDGLFASAGAAPRVTVELDAILTLIAFVKTGAWSSVIPHTFLSLLDISNATDDGLRAIPLTGPDASHALGLVVPDRDPLPSLTQNFLSEATAVDVQTVIDRRVGAE